MNKSVIIEENTQMLHKREREREREAREGGGQRERRDECERLSRRSISRLCTPKSF